MKSIQMIMMAGLIAASFTTPTYATQKDGPTGGTGGSTVKCKDGNMTPYFPPGSPLNAAYPNSSFWEAVAKCNTNGHGGLDGVNDLQGNFHPGLTWVPSYAGPKPPWILTGGRPRISQEAPRVTGPRNHIPAQSVNCLVASDDQGAPRKGGASNQSTNPC